MIKTLFALFFAAPLAAVSQTPQVPHKMQFADMTLTIRDDARREIQKDVDALTQSPRHHNIKVERAKTYFPIIEKIFQEENVPDDFKYLVLQESALIGDAVSVSKAVGFWQFKDFTAVEMGLRVDRDIDERMNIVSSSRAAARYIKKNNVFFNNWLFALQAYQMGAGGVLRSEKDAKSGEKNAEITSKTYWYVKKYLAHKVAFEESVKGAGQIQLLAYQNQSKKSVSDFAKEVSADELELQSYNKWIRGKVIPDDKTYVVVIPVKGNGPAPELKLPDSPVYASAGDARATNTGSQSAAASSRKSGKRKINGITALEASEGENASQLAARGGVEVAAFLKWNDISSTDRIQPGQYYLLGKKRARADKAYHTVSTGENLWSISQLYGVQVNKLKRYNRIESDSELKPGMTLWLSSKKPKNADKNIVETEVVKLDNAQTFAWTASPEDKPVVQAPSSVPVAVVAEKTSDKNLIIPVSTSTDSASAVKMRAPETKDSVQTLQVERTPVTVAPALPKPDSVISQPREVVVVPPPTTHTVQPGETLYAIAKQYNLGVMDLVNMNSLNLQESIKPGLVLKLSDSQPIKEDVATLNKPQTTEHTVIASDTLYGVARKYNVTIKELMEWNDKKDFTLSVGEKLRIVQHK